MRILIRVVAALSTVAAASQFAATGVRAFDAPPSLTVTFHDEVLRALDVPLGNAAATGSRTVTVKNAGSDPVTVALGAELDGVLVTVQPIDAAGPEPITLPAGAARSVIVAATLTNASVVPSTVGSFYADSAGVRTKVMDFTVSRAASTGDILIDQAGTEGIVRTASGSTYKDTITLRPRTTNAIDFTISAGELRGPDNENRLLELRHGDTPLTADVTQRTDRPFNVDLSSSLPVSGIYETDLRLSVGPTSTIVHLKITRAIPSLTLTAGPVQTGSPELGRSASTSVVVVISSPAAVSLGKPLLALKRGTTSLIEGDDFTAVTFLDGTTLNPSDTIDLMPEVKRTVTVRITNLKRTGAYTGTLSLSADGVSGSSDTSFQFGVSRSIWQGFFVIGLGVFASLLITYFVGVRAKTFAAKLQLQPLRDRIAALGPLALDPVDVQLLTDLRGRIDTAEAGVFARDGADPAAVAGVSLRLGLLERVIAASRNLPASGLVRVAAKERLDRTRDFIRSAGNEAETPSDRIADLSAAEQLAGGAPARKSELEDIKLLLSTQRDLLPQGAGLLDQATTALTHTDTEIAQALDDLRPKVRGAMSKSLRDRVSSPAAPPGVADWPGVRAAAAQSATRIDESDTLAMARLQFEPGFAALLNALIEGLARADTDATDQQTLATATHNLERGDLALAAKAYDDARVRFESRAAAATAGVDAVGGGAAAIYAAPPPAPVDVTPTAELFEALSVTPPHPGPTPKQDLYSKLRQVQRAGYAAAFFLATLLGVSTIVLTNPTWGSQGDIISGILWGAGVTAGTSYVGIGKLMQSLGTPGVPTGP